MKRYVALIVSGILLLSFTSWVFADDSGTYRARSGILLNSTAGVPADVLQDPQYQTPEGNMKMEALNRAYSGPLNAAAADFQATTGLVLNFIIENELNFGNTIDEEIGAIVSGGTIINGGLADDQLLMVCVEDGYEVSFAAGDAVKAVLTEDELQRAADAVKAAGEELMVQKALRGVRELFIGAIGDTRQEVLPLSRAGGYLDHPETGVITDLYNVSIFYDSDLASGQGGTQESAGQAASIEYLLDILHHYSGAAVYLYEFAPKGEASSGGSTGYTSAKEAAQGLLDMSHAPVYAFKKVMCRSENNGISIAYDTNTGDGAIILEEDVKTFLTDAEIKSVLAAFSSGGGSKYENVLAGVCKLYHGIFDGSDIEYPQDSLVADVLDHGSPSNKISVLTGVIIAAVIVAAAAVITKKARKRVLP